MSTHSGGGRGRQRSARWNVQPDGSLTTRRGLTSITGDAQAALRSMFGRDLTEAEARTMVGAPQDATLSVDRATAREQGASGPVVGFTLTGPALVPAPAGGPAQPAYTAERYLQRDDQGRLVMYRSITEVQPSLQGHGIGLRMFAREVGTLSRMRDAQGHAIAAIQNEMAGYRGSQEHGYHVWPLMGFNTQAGALAAFSAHFINDPTVPQTARDAIRQIGPDFTILDLYDLGQAARDWWRDKGYDVPGRFKLAPGSESMRTLRDYAASKGVTVP